MRELVRPLYSGQLASLLSELGSTPVTKRGKQKAYNTGRKKHDAPSPYLSRLRAKSTDLKANSDSSARYSNAEKQQ